MLTITAIQSIQLNEMPSIKSDLASLRADANRYLMPRRLTSEQTSKIAKYLSRYDPHQITFDVIRDDQEAASYRGELKRALEEGEWTVLNTRRVDNALEGLILNSQETAETLRRPSRPKRPKPVQMLQRAFEEAGVLIDGGNTQGGGDITADSSTIVVGH